MLGEKSSKIEVEKKKKYFKVFLLIFSVILLIALWDFVPSLIAGLILAYMFSPIFNWFIKKTKKENFSAALTLLISFFIAVIPLTVVSGVILVQTGDLLSSGEVSDIAATFKDFVKSPKMIQEYVPFLSEDRIETSLNNVMTNVVSFVTGIVPSFITSLTDLLLGVFIAFIIMFFALKDKGNFINSIKCTLPFDEKVKNKLEERSKSVIKTVIYGTVLVALVQGLFGAIGFLIFGIEGAAVWGFVMAILSVLPILGPSIIWFPASIYLMLTGHVWPGIGLLLYGVIIISNIDNLTRMKVFNSIGKVHPITTIIGILFGLSIFGVIGLILGPLIIALFVSSLEIAHSMSH